ncbi:MAG: dTDP-glucose 4,6-dehydratase [Candidatus Carbobacillus altaicus]|uniref:dTDP-glucose 4,6-dehydratase n=1 Tax=Candidatus Carbonibacillus altaicus TaxID=2163959 RepID=A0A2R6Y3S7_9BACL|nr:MAG: dTDP-glucose 4,6-dehydratase [Candidatus Carbobacillus altaicus]
MKHALVTGGAGFIGSHLIDRLLEEGWAVTNIDNFDPFYDPAIKRQNITGHLNYPHYTLLELDIRNFAALDAALERQRAAYDVIVHLAAKAGVRPSIDDPIGYHMVNVIGTQHMLEIARKYRIQQFIFASSSSVYGVNPNVPWREDDCVLRPISPYASTKVSGELLGHVYSHLYGIRFIALRFFTVYGPRQRPDLAIHKFARLMLEGKPIPIYGDGSTRRDYTYIDDISEGVRRAMDYEASSYEIINLGNNQTVTLNEMVETLEMALSVKVARQYLSEQPGDVPATWADVNRAKRILHFRPKTPFEEGVKLFVEWLRANVT